MTLLKTSAICASASILSYLWVVIRGDIVCPGDLSACLIGIFFLLGLAATVSSVLGILRRRQKTISN